MLALLTESQGGKLQKIKRIGPSQSSCSLPSSVESNRNRRARKEDMGGKPTILKPWVVVSLSTLEIQKIQVSPILNHWNWWNWNKKKNKI